MGEVYRARDTILKRDVALKVLPAALAHDPERMARFQREAELLASLNHPSIAIIHGLVDSEGQRALVMELVPGETLGDRMRHGVLPPEEALIVARQIAEALEAAHEKGVVHRDLKPGNVMITPSGLVKVLDFGLASMVQGASSTPPDPANSPTLTMNMTQAGVILGTAAYMSPEQAAGTMVDKRADIWSYGVVLWEMLSGRRLFGGDTIAHTLADVLRAPIDFDKTAAPAPIKNLLRRCLDRDPKTRLRDIGEARVAVAKYLADPQSETEVAGPHGSPPKRRLAWAISAVLAAALGTIGFIHFREQPPQQPDPVRFQIQPGLTLGAAGPFSISPDGRKMVLVAAGPDGTTRLWIRSLDSLELRSLPGTETAPNVPPPFWSPDSRWIAYDASGKLKKVAVTGGPPQTLSAVSAPVVGGSWNRDDTILFSVNLGGIMQIPASGGTPVPLTVLDASRKEAGHVFPTFLPDGRHFIYLSISTLAENSGVYVGSMDTKASEQPRRKVVGTEYGPAYVPPVNSVSGVGHLLFRREKSLMAQPFDDRTQELSGEAVPVAEGLNSFLANGFFSASNNGVLVHRAGGGQNSQLTWFDQQGGVVGAVGEPGYYESLALSPDNKQTVFSRLDFQTISQDLWLLDFSRGATIRFTFGAGLASNPVWSPDGSRIAFAATRDGQSSFYQKLASGAKDQEVLLNVPAAAGFPFPTSWSRDGRFLAYTAVDAKTGSDVWVLPLENRKPFPLLHTQFSESNGQFSPDMRWVAYGSNESGREEVYVRAFSPDNPESASTGKWIVSKGGGMTPKWRAYGKELTYVRPDGKLMSVAIAGGAAFQAANPRELIQLTTGGGPVDVAADGRVLQAIPVEKNSQVAFTVVLNWQVSLKK